MAMPLWLYRSFKDACRDRNLSMAEGLRRILEIWIPDEYRSNWPTPIEEEPDV